MLFALILAFSQPVAQGAGGVVVPLKQPANPPAKPAVEQKVDIGAFTEFPCFENRTKYQIGGYVRTGGGNVAIVRVAPDSGGCLAKLRPDPANPGMTVGTAFLDRSQTTEGELLGREVKCVMSPADMIKVGFRVVVLESDDGLSCQSRKLDTAR
jgi:hypothetical protein